MPSTKAQNQITIVDLTDAYSVMLSLDAVALNGSTTTLGTAQTVVVNVSAFRGSEQLTPTVGTPTCPTGVTASVGQASNKIVPVTISFAATLSSAGRVVLPVTVDSSITINKEFAFSISFKGQPGQNGQDGQDGAPGQNGQDGQDGADGEDAINLVITSSAGTIFKNTAIVTTLTAHVYKGGAEVTGSALSALGTIKWYKDGGSTAVGTGTTLSISAGDVTNKAVYEARLEG